MQCLQSDRSEQRSLIASIKKQSYSDVVKKPADKRKWNGMETPRSSRTPRISGASNPKIPGSIGTSNLMIGKPLSPPKQRQRKKPEKAIWISRLHRDTTVEEISSYAKDKLGIAVDELDIRKLVKKDRPISEYTFVSFKISCSTEVFGVLMDINKWPSSCQIREFKLDMYTSTPQGVRLNENEINLPKNGDQPPHDHPTSKQTAPMEV